MIVYDANTLTCEKRLTVDFIKKMFLHLFIVFFA